MKKQISIRASAHAIKLIEQLKAQMGLNQTEVILLALQQLNEAQK